MRLEDAAKRKGRRNFHIIAVLHLIINKKERSNISSSISQGETKKERNSRMKYTRLN
jgi:hypothetical protein